MRTAPSAAFLLAVLCAPAFCVLSPAAPKTVWDRIMEEQSVVNLRRGYARMDSRDYAAAADDFYRAEQENPSDPMPHVLYGSALYWLGEPEKAGDEFDEALRLDPKNSMAYQLRGIVRARAGTYKDALDDFLAAERLDPTRADVKMNAGSVYEALGDPDHSLEYFRAAAALDAQNPLYRYQLGMLYSRLGRYDQAEEQLGKAVSLFSGYEDAMLELAVLKERDGDLAGAVKLYRKALSVKPRDSVARFRLGWALRKAGRGQEAAKVLDEAFLLAPANEKGGISMGLAYAGGRKKEEPDPVQGGPLASALKRIPAGQSARVTIELLETPKASLTKAPAGEKLGGSLASAFRKPKVNYTKREYFLPAASAEERGKKAAEIAAEVDKLMNAVSASDDVRLNFDIETGPPAATAKDEKAKAVYNPRDVGNDMGLWVMGDNWLDNVSEALEEMDGAGEDARILRGLGYLLLGEHSLALQEFSGGSAQAALGRSAAWVEAGSEEKALAECLAALKADPANKSALANKAWLGAGK
jgi:tetratricopeptide (TPR) repeat protein